jgi:hypothetical protein
MTNRIVALLTFVVIVCIIGSNSSANLYGQQQQQPNNLETVLGKALESLKKKPSGITVAQNEDAVSIPTTDTKDPNYNNYENTTFGLKIKYPKDWTFRHNVFDRISNPETIFDVGFFSPFENQVDSTSLSVNIERLDSGTTSLEKSKNQIVANLKSSYPDVKEIHTSKTTVGGKPAYKIEYLTNLIDHWEKAIDFESVANGTLYEVSILGKPEHVNKYSTNINEMINSLEFKQPQVHFEQVYDAQTSKMKKSATQTTRYVNDKCGVSLVLPKGIIATPSEFVFEDSSKTLADFQSTDDDIFSLYFAIQNAGYSGMSPSEISQGLVDYASLNPESTLIESDIGQIGGYPSYKTVYSEGSTPDDTFYTFDSTIIAHDREYRLVFEAASKAEFDKYKSAVEDMAKTIKISQPNFEGIDC